LVFGCKLCVIGSNKTSCFPILSVFFYQRIAPCDARRKSAHPISAAIVSRAVGCIGDAFESAELPEVKKFRNLPGIGIQGSLQPCSNFLKCLEVAAIQTVQASKQQKQQGARMMISKIRIIMTNQ